MDEILKNLRQGPNFVATIDGDHPKNRPFGPALNFNGHLYLFTSNHKAVYRQILKNPHIEIISMISDFEWQRLSATATPDPRPEVIQAFLDDDPELPEMGYSVDDGHSTPIKLTHITATIYQDDGVTKTIKL